MSAERRLFFATSFVSRSTEDDVTNFRSEVGVAIFRWEVGAIHSYIFYLSLDTYKDRVLTGPHGPFNKDRVLTAPHGPFNYPNF
jgi:hypothetical protein